jgi:hypothetical protein
LRKLTLLLGLFLLLAGIGSESLFIASEKVAYNGFTISTNTYLVTGLILILVGLLFTLSSRIPKIRIP